MIQIELSVPEVHRKMVHVKMKFKATQNEQVIQLSSWRPGRYEIGNFAKNVSHVRCSNAQGDQLRWNKAAKDQWQIHNSRVEELIFEFNYNAAELNAGSTYVNSQMLYVNPVNCIPFIPGFENQPYEIRIVEDYAFLSSGLQVIDGIMHANSFDEVADSPFVASHKREILKETFLGCTFEAHLFGNATLDRERFWNDVKKYTELQVAIFGDFPDLIFPNTHSENRNYIYLLHFTPYFMHHGVEHTTSTVIVMGPGDTFDKEEKYNELLAICSHELFHTWNIKTLRPADMMPYDFTRENYSQLGYVAEGVTTYYGDLCLIRSGIWNIDLWKNSLEQWLNNHHKNFGRFSYSVADSSVDTWLDGYTPGTPWRKVSIYNEGALLSIYLDLQLIIQSEGKYSLDDVMRQLYQTKGKSKQGYTADDYWNTLSDFGLANANFIRATMAESPFDFSEVLRESFEKIGVQLTWEDSPISTERLFGFGVEPGGIKTKLNLVAPESAADKAGLWYGDEIIEIDGIGVEKNAPFLLEDRTEAHVRFIRNSVPFETTLQVNPDATTIKRSKLEFVNPNHPLFKFWIGSRK